MLGFIYLLLFFFCFVLCLRFCTELFLVSGTGVVNGNM